MARIRSQHPGIFTDEAYMTLSFAARELLRGLWAQADDQGVFEWKPLTLKVRIFPANTVDVDALLAELAAANFIRAYPAEGRPFGAVRNFMKYQRPRKPSYVHPLPDALRGYVGMAGAEPVPNQYGTGSVLPPQREKKEEGGKRKEEGKEGVQEGVQEEPQEEPQEGRAAAAAASPCGDLSLSGDLSVPGERGLPPRPDTPQPDVSPPDTSQPEATALVAAFRQERAALWPGSGPAATTPASAAEAATAARVLTTAAQLGLPAGQVRGEARDYLRMRLTALRDKGRPPPATLSYFQTALCEHLTALCTPPDRGGLPDGGALPAFRAPAGGRWGAAAAAAAGRRPRGMTGEEADRVILETLGMLPKS